MIRFRVEYNALAEDGFQDRKRVEVLADTSADAISKVKSLDSKFLIALLVLPIDLNEQSDARLKKGYSKTFFFVAAALTLISVLSGAHVQF